MPLTRMRESHPNVNSSRNGVSLRGTMPFYLCRLDEDAIDRVRSHVPLAGLNGPLCGASL
jgi:hypothetical protein